MKKITNNYYLLLINLKIALDGYVTHKPSKSPKTPLPLDGGGRGWPPAQRASGSERGEKKI
jgi:hypothetical protein